MKGNTNCYISLILCPKMFMTLDYYTYTYTRYEMFN